MLRPSRMAVLLAAVLTGACFHATIETGLPASATVVQKDWANGFIFGLVPPSTVETKAQCPNGVARVETQHSFLNMLASFITFNLYTPMTITVTCASSNRMASLPATATVLHSVASADGIDATLMQRAFDQAVKTGAPVYVDLR